MKLFIKNMVCLSCEMIVRSEMEKLGINCIAVEPGWVEINDIPSANQIINFKTALLKAGLELIDNKNAILIEKIKIAVLDLLNDSNYVIKINFSYYLSQKLGLDYTYLANMFSKTNGSTIENYIIISKIRRVKELICDKELSLTEISWKLNYSSVAHLSTQFKKVTGITPSRFKDVECNSLLPQSMCEL